MVIDGDISDAAWVDSALVDTWWETNPGDNLEPKVKNLAWMGYDDGYLYAAFKFEDSAAGSIRAPLGDRDSIGSPNDYGGVILDPRGDGKTAQMFLANPRGIQYDALTSDDAGEDSSPDFFWESAGRITENGWTLEIRIPFSSIRYVESNPRNWGILLYRNHPRDYRYQYFSSRLPRERNCFICNSRELTGLADLPTGDQYVIAPFATASQLAEPENGVGTPLRTADPESEIGLDAKWIPNPDTVIDGTINPDFSQIETDTAQITANERFALFLPEKRPFFLESVDLFSTPINAVYTRSFSNPEWGGRITGSSTRDKYTVLVGQDEAGGSLILPGPEGSDLADADFDSTVVLARYRHDFGKAFAGLIYSGREIPDEGSAYNRVVGPDFEWRPNGQNTVRGQFLVSQSQTPIDEISPKSGTAANSMATPATSGGTSPTAKSTLSSNTRRSATSSAPTSASCPRSATGSPTAKAATPGVPRSVRFGASAASSTVRSRTPSTAVRCAVWSPPGSVSTPSSTPSCASRSRSTRSGAATRCSIACAPN